MTAVPAAHPIAPTESDPVFSDSFWKRFQQKSDRIERVPLLVLDANASIQRVSRAARTLLEYGSDQDLDPYFFTHVHGRNLRRVMQDLAHMACCRKRKARWLLRLRTGSGRWRWFQATVLNCLDAAQQGVFIRLERV